MADEITQVKDEGRKKALMRFFSVDSDINVTPNLQPSTFNFYSKDFCLKIAQLLIAIICVGLYTQGITISAETVVFACFPNVVFGSYIIITAVIIISYVFEQAMPNVIVRVFLSVGMILYFISATVTTTIWFSTAFRNSGLELPKALLLLQALLSYVNSLLYGLDLVYNIQKAVEFQVEGPNSN